LSSPSHGYFSEHSTHENNHFSGFELSVNGGVIIGKVTVMRQVGFKIKIGPKANVNQSIIIIRQRQNLFTVKIAV